MRPVAFFVYWAVFAQLISMNEVCGLTNAEFYDLIKDYTTDVDVLDSESVGIDDYLQDDNDDVINLTGGPVDEIDLEYIAEKLGLIQNDNNPEDLDYETGDTDEYLRDDNDEDTYLQRGPDDELDAEFIADEQVLGSKADAIGDYLQDGAEEPTNVQGRTDNKLDEYNEDHRSLTSNNEVGFSRYRRRRRRRRRHRRRRHRRRRHRRRRHRRRRHHKRRHHNRRRHRNRRHRNRRHHNRRHRNRRHHNSHRRHSRSGCTCEVDSCSCCLTKRFRFGMGFTLHSCVNVAHLQSNSGFEVTFSINDNDLFHKEISLENPPAMCFRVPGMRNIGEACLEFYDVNSETMNACARLSGILDLKVKEISIDQNFGCFRIPGEQALTNLLNDEDFLPPYIQASDAGGKVVDRHDLDTIYHLLQDVQGDENSDDV